MADQKVSALTTIPAVDRATDLLYIVDTSGGTSNKVTPNSLLGISGDPVGTSDTQTITGKTLTSPTISSPTLSGTIAGTYTLGGTPTFPSTVVSTTGTQTLTNKTLTSPTINTATIVNPTLTTDTVSEYSSAAGVTIDGVLLKDAKINGSYITDATVGSSQITSGAVTPVKLSGFDWGKFLVPGTYSAVSGTWTLTDAATSGNPFFFTIRSSAQNEYIEFKTVLEAGTYAVGIQYDKDINRGIATLTIDGSSVGSTIDMYAGSRTNATFTNFSTSYALATTKLVTLRITIATKNASSIGYILGLYGVVIRRSA